MTRKRIDYRKTVGILIAAGIIAVAIGTGFVSAQTNPFGLQDMQNMARGTIPHPFRVHRHGEGEGSRGVWLKLQTKQPADVFTVRLTLRPGKDSGWHTHRGAVLAVVEEGRVVNYNARCQRTDEYDSGARELPVAIPAAASSTRETSSTCSGTRATPTRS